MSNKGSKRRLFVVSDSNLINENTVYADNSIQLETVILYGKWKVKNGIKCRENIICTDILPLLLRREE